MAVRPKPLYFDEIRNVSRARWDTLEGDPDLAAPWRQLFRQVQSPRHVLSELLQNADDAGARNVAARVQGNAFVFEHDGQDFASEHFASLCKFGNSNKRKLHTIGFRGIGFKSTFSLGDEVEVVTPSLAVRFAAERFTEPRWMEDAPHTELTTIRVLLADENRRQDLEASFAQWAKSPASLLFFSNVRRLQLGGRAYEKTELGPGPVPGSLRIGLSGAEGQRELLVVSSGEEDFPLDALAEVREERGEASLQLPGCALDLVLGLPEEGRIYVVLPTDVRLKVPFCVNAPFVQDPARIGLKAPSRSATNRWLLERAGRLAATALKAWLANPRLSISERARAYAILPDPGAQVEEASREAETRVRGGLESQLKGSPLALTGTGEVVGGRDCVSPPRALYGVWESDDALASAIAPGMRVVTSEVRDAHRIRVAYWARVNVLSDSDAASAFRDRAIPRPSSWNGLALLWGWVQATQRSDWSGAIRRAMRIVPSVGSDTLLSGDDVVRLPKDTKGFADEDWAFLLSLLKAVDPEWLDFLGSDSEGRATERDLLRVLGHERATSGDQLAIRAFAAVLRNPPVKRGDALRLTRILAKLDAAVPSDFGYVTRDAYVRRTSAGLSLDLDHTVGDLLPDKYRDEHILDDMYQALLDSADSAEVLRWMKSAKSGLVSSPLLAPAATKVEGEYWLTKQLVARGCDRRPTLQRKTSSFIIRDFDFVTDLLTNWNHMAKDDALVWARVVRVLLAGEARYWEDKLRASVRQATNQGNEYAVGIDDLQAMWVTRLQKLPCLLDTHGKACFPPDLLLRSPETDDFRDIEPFVEARVDTPSNRGLLVALGVRTAPADPTKVVDSIGLLATQKAAEVVQQLTRRYAQLDALYAKLTASQQAEIRNRFTSERLILTVGDEWKAANEVVQDAGEFDPDMLSVLHPCARQLPIWSRLGVAERPGEQFILSWLEKLPTGLKLEARDAERVRAALAIYPHKIWMHCGHWISLDGTWEPRESLRYRLTMKGLTRWSDLFQNVKATIGDLRMLSSEVTNGTLFQPLAELGTRLSSAVTDVVEVPTSHDPRSWLTPLATGLRRTSFKDPETTARVRGVADRLLRSRWVAFRKLAVTPVLDGVPAGTPFMPQAVWDSDAIYVGAGPLAALVNEVSAEIARPFGSREVEDAIRSCIGRDKTFVETYLEAHLLMEDEAVSPPVDASGAPKAASAEPLPGNLGTPVPSPPPGSEGHSPDAGGAEDAARSSASRREQRPAIDEYARAVGYSRAENGDYVRDDGVRLERNGTLGWNGFDAYGGHVARYWVAEGTIDDGIELPSEVWNLFDAEPDLAHLIVKRGGRMVEYSARELFSMRDSGTLEVYAARYRMRLRSHTDVSGITL